jgi:hypothetical protein
MFQCLVLETYFIVKQIQTMDQTQVINLFAIRYQTFAHYSIDLLMDADHSPLTYYIYIIQLSIQKRFIVKLLLLLCCVLSGEVTTTFFSVFSLTRPGLDP